MEHAGGGGDTVLDVEAQALLSDTCSGDHPGLKKSLSRKASNLDDASRKLEVKVIPSHKAFLAPPAPATTASSPAPPSECGEGRSRRFHRFMAIHPRNVVVFFATLSSVGTMILIYFTLAINQGTGS